MKLQMCRICLVDNVAMLPIAKTPLLEIYEKLSEIKLETNTSRPVFVCYICYARLRNCYYLRNSCLYSEKVFTSMITSNNEVRPSYVKTVLKSNFLTIAPVFKMNICDLVHERDKVGSANEERIKTEATLNEEIVIKMEDDTSESDPTNELIYADDDLGVDIKDEDVADDQLHSPEADDEREDSEGSEVENKHDQGAPAKKRLLTTPTAERCSSILKKTESAETRKKGGLLTSKSHKTNKDVVTGTLISEDKILDKLENKTKLQENIVTSCDFIKESIVYSDANIKPSRRDLSGKTNFETHLHKPTNGKRYMCDICNKQCNNNSNLVRHLRTHTGEKPFTCNICNKQFTLKSTLVTHLRTHTGEKPFTCYICKKQFTQKPNLVTHLRLHSGDKPFTCNICKKPFRHKPYLISHLRIHSGEKPFICNICKKQFSLKPYLVTHLRIHTGEKPFTCNICKKQFSHKTTLERHIRTHTGKKPFTCNICNKQFSCKSSLVSHLPIHTGEKPFTCNICSKQFYRKHNLVSHLRKHTGSKLTHETKFICK